LPRAQKGRIAEPITARFPSLLGIVVDFDYSQIIKHLPVDCWVTPEEFNRWKQHGEAKGLRHIESGTLVRSSYHAEKQVDAYAAV